VGINLWKCGSFSYWFDNLGLTTEGKLAAVLIITLLLGFTNKLFWRCQLGAVNHHSSLYELHELILHDGRSNRSDDAVGVSGSENIRMLNETRLERGGGIVRPRSLGFLVGLL
jgi:hypothetical protein